MSSVGLGAVFDDFQGVFPREIENRVHVRREAVEMDWDDRLGAICEAFWEIGWIES